jgi:hypothetical protein
MPPIARFVRAFSLVWGTFRRRSFHSNWMCLDFVDEYLVCQTLYFVVLLNCTSLTSITSMLRTRRGCADLMVSLRVSVVPDRLML